MLNPEERKKLQDILRTHWFLFIAHVGAVVLYTVVVFAVVGGGSREPHEIGALKPLFISITLVLGAIKFLIQSRLWLNEDGYGRCGSLEEIMVRYGHYYNIVLALCEAAPLLGLVTVFLTMRMGDWWLFLGIAVVLFATSAPRADKVERIVQAHALRMP